MSPRSCNRDGRAISRIVTGEERRLLGIVHMARAKRSKRGFVVAALRGGIGVPTKSSRRRVTLNYGALSENHPGARTAPCPKYCAFQRKEILMADDLLPIGAVITAPQQRFFSARFRQ
jgi:hypothetical protein